MSERGGNGRKGDETVMKPSDDSTTEAVDGVVPSTSGVTTGSRGGGTGTVGLVDTPGDSRTRDGSRVGDKVSTALPVVTPENTPAQASNSVTADFTNPGGDGVDLNQTAELKKLEEDTKRNQQQEDARQAALIEVHLPWSEEEAVSSQETHRTFQRYEADLIKVGTIMRNYAYSDEDNDPVVVNAVHLYIENAQRVYEAALMRWMQKNDTGNAAKSHPAVRKVTSLMANLHEKLKVKLVRYHKKALQPPDLRSRRSKYSEDSSSSSSSSHQSSLKSDAAKEAIAKMELHHRKSIEALQKQLVDMKVAMEARAEADKATNSREAELKEHLAKVQDAAAAEKRSLMQQHVQEKEELMEKSTSLEQAYGKLEQEMRLGRDRMQIEKQTEIDRIEKAKRDLELDTATKIKKIELQNKDMELEHRSRVAVLQAELDKAKSNELAGVNAAAGNSKGKMQENAYLHRPLMESSFGEFAAKYPPPFVPDISTKNAASTRVGFVASTSNGHPPENTSPKRPKTPIYGTPHPLDGAYGTEYQVNNADQQKMNPPAWKTTANHNTTPPAPAGWSSGNDSLYDNDYMRGKMDGRLNEKYVAMFQAGRHETDRKFSGRLEDYPMYRQDLQQHFELLWRNEPRTLLRKIANSVEDEVWNKIKSAWVERDPWESLNMIWEILEDEYGDPSILLNHAIRQLVKETRSVESSTSSLTSFRAKMRNLKAVARSIQRERELANPKLLIKIMDLFSSDLNAKFEIQNPNPKNWSFEGILQFVNTQVDVLRFRNRHLNDVSAVMTGADEYESRSREKPFKSYAVQEKEPLPKRLETTPCDFHPKYTTHSIAECRTFGEMSPQERFDHIKKSFRCYICLGPHLRRACPQRSSISCDICGKKHHTLLHLGDFKKSQAQQKKVTIGVLGAPDNPPDETAAIPIMALTAVVYNEKGKVKKTIPFYAALDTGAERTLCSKFLAQKLGDWNPHDRAQLQFLDGNPKEFKCMRQPLHLKLRTSNNVISMQEAIFIDTKLPFNESIPDSEVIRRRQSPGVEFPVICGNRRIDMIMGSPHINMFGIFFNTKWTKSPEGLQVGLHRLGEVWWGLKEDEKATPYIRIVRCLSVKNSMHLESHVQQQTKHLIEDDHGIGPEESSTYAPAIYEEVRRYALDTLVMEPNHLEKCPSRDDEEVLKFFEENIEEVMDDSGQIRLQLPLPWKSGPVHKPQSRWQAERSLHKQHKRFEKAPEIRKKYKGKFGDMKSEDHLERIPPEEIDMDDPEYPVNYLLHFATNLLTKFRVVYHGAFKIGNHSINDLLHRGPILNESLLNILVRFRQHKYAICGDIKNMYFQILVHPKDRDMLRVVYYDDDGRVAHYRFKVMPYGLKPVSSIAGFCIRYTAMKNYAGASNATQETLLRSVYVDDVLDSCPTLEEARDRVNEVKTTLASTGFHVKKWLSSNSKALDDIPAEDRADEAVKEFDSTDEESSSHKALGIAWIPTSDVLMMRKLAPLSPQEGVLTQRIALSQLNSYFDPMGLWCPFFVHLKKLYSDIAKSTDGWDQPVDEEFRKKWKEAEESLKDIQKLTFSRNFVDLPAESTFEIHVFSDASVDFIGAAIYLRAIFDGRFQCALIYGKSRIISAREISTFSIARKELLALVMATDMVAQCKSALTLNVTKTVMWTDNTTVVKWCACKSKELLVFVRNRVNKILKESGGALPKYVQSADNPADIATRPLKKDTANDIELWKRGAPFLWKPDEEWDLKEHSFTTEEIYNDDLVTAEINPVKGRILSVEAQTINPNRTILEQLDCGDSAEEVESRLLLVRYCFRALRNNARRRRGDADDGKMDMEDTTLASWKSDLEEKENCRLLLVKWAQREAMKPVLDAMGTGKTYEEAYSSIPRKMRAVWMGELRRYVPFLDAEGVLRVGGRLDEADLTFAYKHPAFLPRRHWITGMYIKAKHFDLLHLGKDAVFASMQQDWGLWPVSNTSTIGHYLAGCEGCKLRQQVRGTQLMSTLPRERVTARGHVFRNVSVDYAGPFRVTHGRGCAKRYLCVFVCMSTTAVRLILVRDLTASFFLSALRRFLARSGFVTKQIRSDNGGNFVGSATIMQKEAVAALEKVNDSPELRDALSRWSISWKFGPPEASHHGGIYERQIRTIRQILLALPEMMQRVPTNDELETSLADAEYVMNCRPLTKSPTSDGLPPLRPRDLMFGALDPVDVCGPPTLSDPADILRRGHLRSRRISELFWERWIAEYLPAMQKRSKWLMKSRNFAVGDLILLCDEVSPGYLKYPYAVVINATPDNDGYVRTVTARMSDGTKRTRDIRKIALIDAIEGREIP